MRLRADDEDLSGFWLLNVPSQTDCPDWKELQFPKKNERFRIYCCFFLLGHWRSRLFHIGFPDRTH